MAVPAKIPIVTDEDIDWVAAEMGLNDLDEPRRNFLKATSTLDVSACPGSGKTTLIVAKLAIMARNWPHRTSGVCVLSHTNVAREEIQNRLGNTAIGHRLLRYPHFIDTIHAFVNRFLALPYLQSGGFPPPLIDDDVAKAYRWRVLDGQARGILRNFLDRHHAKIDDITFSDAELSVVLINRPFPAGPDSRSYQSAQAMLLRSVEVGYYRYEEMFVWAEHLLAENSNISAALSQRFPLVLIDEMQDTSERQVALLKQVFDRTNDGLVVQRVGDPNQEIFKSGPDQNISDPFPDTQANRIMSVPSSRRFGNAIARLANPLAVEPVGDDGLSGVGPAHMPERAGACANLLIIFPNDDATGVLDAFSGHVLDSFSDVELALGDVVAIGGVHQLAPEIPPGHAHYPKTVPHYCPTYNPDTAKKNKHPETLVGYLHDAREIVRLTGDIGEAIAIFCVGIVRLVKMIGEAKAELGRTRKHKAIKLLLEGSEECSAQYTGFIDTYISSLSEIDAEGWGTARARLSQVAAELCTGDSDDRNAENYLIWSDQVVADPTEVDNAPLENIWIHTKNERQVKVRLGSIHGAKGQTHLATLLLSTYNYNHSSVKMIDWLCGRRCNGAGEGVRVLNHMKQSYVAMTRPTHLLGVAVRDAALFAGGKERDVTIAALREKGWQILDLC